MARYFFASPNKSGKTRNVNAEQPSRVLKVYQRLNDVLLADMICRLVAVSCLLCLAWLAISDSRLSQRCDEYLKGEVSRCDDGNPCTVDFFDPVALRCFNWESACTSCKQHGSSTGGVDFVALLPREAVYNSSFQTNVAKALALLLQIADKNGVSARLSLAVYEAGRPQEIVLDFAGPSDELENAIASSLSRLVRDSSTISSGLTASATVDDALLALFAVWSNASFLRVVSESGEEFGATRVACDAHLAVRRAVDVHTILFVAGSRVASTPEEDVTRTIVRIMNSIVEKTPPNSRRELAVTAFIDSVLSTDALGVFGDPRLDRTYPDKRCFNRAETLKALIREGAQQASSLQAYLLAKGVDCRVFDISDVLDERVLRGLHRSILEPPAVTCSECRQAACNESTGCIYKKRVCHEDSFCSPVVGCVKKNASASATHTLPLVVFQNSYGNTSWKQALQTRPVPIKNWSPAKHFVSDLISGGQPVVLRQTVASQWPAITKWDDEFFRDALPNTLVDVKRTATSLTFDPDSNAAMSRLPTITLETPYTLHNMTRKELLDKLSSDSTIGHYYFTSLPENLHADLTQARLLFAEDRDFELRRHFLWISSRGMVTHTHFDQDYNIFVQLSGTKTFTLWPAEEHELMYLYPRIHPMWHKSQVRYGLEYPICR